jgi:hypothetical protein
MILLFVNIKYLMCSRFIYFLSFKMFMPSDTSSTSRRTRSNEPTTKWEYAKTFYYDPVKW